MTHSTSLSGIKLSAILALCLTLSMCKDTATTDTGSAGKENTAEDTQKMDPKQLEAQKAIEADPDVELVEAKNGKIELRNVHTQIGMVLSFQDIIDGKYDAIKGGKAEAGKVLKPKDSAAMAKDGAEGNDNWGKAPKWLPRYPDLKISPGKIHGARKDGSIWGQISGTHRDPVEKMREQLIAGFKSSGMVLASEMNNENSITLIFENPPSDKPDEEQEKRRVGCAIRNAQGVTYLDMQYTYGN